MVVDECFDPFLETFVGQKTWIGCKMHGLRFEAEGLQVN